LIRARQFDEAIEFVQKSLYATDPKALKMIEQAKSKRFKEMLRETEKLIRARQYDEAIEFVQKSLYATDPKALKMIEVAQRKRFDDELFKANKLIKTYQFDEAIEFIKKTQYATDPKALKLIEIAQRKRFDEKLFIANKLIKAHKFDEAIEFIQQIQYATDPKALNMIERAKYRRKKAQESNILANLQRWPSTEIETHIKAYTNLIKLFPDNKEYQRKLSHYKKKRIELRRQPALFMIQEDYGEKWPFTLPNGELECYHPGIVTFKANGITYAVNGLAKSRGYAKIDDILKIDPNIIPNQNGLQQDMGIVKMDIRNIIKRGLELCKPQ
jgi:flagellum-specific peptidoglycan hydrolase FlgJ